MYNLVYLIGRLVSDPELKKTTNLKDFATITLAVQRSFKNVDGLYETDFIKCKLWNGIAHNTSEYCKKGDLVGVKGRLQISSYETEDGDKKYVTDVIAEKVTFLTSKKADE